MYFELGTNDDNKIVSKLLICKYGCDVVLFHINIEFPRYLAI